MPVRHLVLFRFHDGTEAAAVDALATGLRELPALIPQIVDYHVGPDLGLGDGAWDFAVSADFADAEDWATYRDHPEHRQRIADLVAPLVEQRCAIQIAL